MDPPGGNPPARESTSAYVVAVLQVRISRGSDYARAETAKQDAAARYRELQKTEQLAADLSNKERSLKERVSIDAGKERSKARVAVKADEIARKMQQLADKADGEWEEAKKELKRDSSGYADVSKRASAALGAAEVKEVSRRKSEERAADAARRLAKLDRTIEKLLGKKTQLESQATAQDDSSATVRIPALAMKLFSFAFSIGEWVHQTCLVWCAAYHM